MTKICCPRLLITADKSGSGSSFITLGIISKLVELDFSISVVFIGENYQESLLVSRIIKRDVVIINPQIQSKIDMLNDIYLASLGSDLMIIVSEYALFENNFENTYKNSAAEMSFLTKSPAVLVVDNTFDPNTLSSNIKGYQSIISGFTIDSVIINCFKDSEYSDFKDSIEKLNTLNYLCTVSKSTTLLNKIPNGLNIFENYTNISHTDLLAVKDFISSSIDFEKLVYIAKSAPNISFPGIKDRVKSKTRIAVCTDPCFSLTNGTNVKYLNYFGAEIVEFSFMYDLEIPEDIGGIYMPSSLIFSYLEDIYQNQEMIKKILDFIYNRGLFLCLGSSSYLFFAKFIFENKKYQGLNLIKEEIELTQDGFKLGKLNSTNDSILSFKDNEKISAVLGNSYKILGENYNSKFDFKAKDQINKDGIMPTANSLFFLSDIYLSSNLEFVKRFVDESYANFNFQ